MSAGASLLRGLELFRVLHPDITVSQILAFLYVAESEGLLIRDVARAGGFSQSTASRSLRANGIAGSGWAVHPALGLIEAFLGKDDARGHALHLTEAGRHVYAQLAVVMAPKPSTESSFARARARAD